MPLLSITGGAGLRTLLPPHLRGARAYALRYVPGDSVAALLGSFARASTATYTNASGVVTAIASGVLRDAHYVAGVRTTLVEPQRTNYATQSGAMTAANGYASAGATDAGAGATAPDGVTASRRYLFTVNGGALQKSCALGSANANRSFTVSVWARWVNGSKRVRVDNVQDGSTTTAGSVVVLPADGSWTRLTTVRTNGAGGTSSQTLQVTADTDDGNGNPTIDLWGAQVEEGDCVSSYIPTVGATVTRAADALWLPAPLAQVAQSILWDGYLSGTYTAGGRRLYNIGNDNDPRILASACDDGTKHMHARTRNGSAQEAYARINGTIAATSRVEHMTSVAASGATTLAVSVDGGAASTHGPIAISGAGAYGGAWSASKVWIGRDDSGSVGGSHPVALRKLVIAAGVQTLATMRGL